MPRPEQGPRTLDGEALGQVQEGGLGEAGVFLFMGLFAVTAAAYLQTGRFTWPAFAASLPVGLLVADILLCHDNGSHGAL